MSNRLRIVIALFLLLGAVLVDFVSVFISFAFDAFFVGSAVYVMWPMIKEEIKNEFKSVKQEIKERL